MAATDKHYRNQYTLDIVFAVSSVAMLLSMIWMLAQDFAREYKEEQRTFRDVERALAQRLAFEQIPAAKEITDAEELVEEKKKLRASQESQVHELKSKLAADQPKREKAEA